MFAIQRFHTPQPKFAKSILNLILAAILSISPELSYPLELFIVLRSRSQAPCPSDTPLCLDVGLKTPSDQLSPDLKCFKDS